MLVADLSLHCYGSLEWIYAHNLTQNWSCSTCQP
jgi:hypothetical protein